MGANTQFLTELNPEYLQHYSQLAAILAKPSAPDAVTKELIILAVAINQRCEPCIAVHVDQYIKAGGNYEQLSDLDNIAILVDGDPGMAFAGKVLDCFDRFLKYIKKPEAFALAF
ncbi:carboxymuconolactone decarboxylase family protein [Facklamia sp. P13055]|uniref:carboxymuconolactone decarboxylase family protein n=1 Tax=Facklamia sp. P13055 TaxID=3421952 RepID=UPI003D1794E3